MYFPKSLVVGKHGPTKNIMFVLSKSFFIRATNAAHLTTTWVGSEVIAHQDGCADWAQFGLFIDAVIDPKKW